MRSFNSNYADVIPSCQVAQPDRLGHYVELHCEPKHKHVFVLKYQASKASSFYSVTWIYQEVP